MKKKIKFKPNSKYVADALEEFLKNGGQITKITQEDIEDSKIKLTDVYTDAKNRKKRNKILGLDIDLMES
jgi:hypothetical protein